MNLETISRQDFTLNKELSYLLGVYLSDGSITGCNFNLQVVDKDFAENTLSFIKKIIPSCVSVLRKRDDNISWNKNRRYVVKAGLGDYAKWFKQQTNEKHHIPLCIWKAPDVLKRWFVAGIMDGDGWISKTKRQDSLQYQYRIGIGGVEDGWINEFRELLGQMHVKCNKMERFLTKNGKVFCRFHMKPKTFFNAKLFFTVTRKQDRCKIASTTAR